MVAGMVSGTALAVRHDGLMKLSALIVDLQI